jgi:hypothetical protein
MWGNLRKCADSFTTTARILKSVGRKQLLHHLLSTKTLGGLWTDAECGWSFYNNNNKRPRALWLVKSLRNGCCVISGAWKKPLGSQSIRCEHTSSVVCVESKAHQLHELAVHPRLRIFIISSCGHKDWSKEIRGGRTATVALASTTTSITLDTPSSSTTTRVTLGVRLV